MVRNLDKYNFGFVDWRMLATFIILLRTPIPTDAQLDQYKVAFQTKDDLRH